MKLERIHIERFGAWQNLDLPVDPEGISVYYGANEAGKSTLMRFVRGVLYGFRPNESGRPADDDGTRPWGGALQIEHDAGSWIIRRSGQGDSSGLVTSWPAEHEPAEHEHGEHGYGEHGYGEHEHAHHDDGHHDDGQHDHAQHEHDGCDHGEDGDEHAGHEHAEHDQSDGDNRDAENRDGENRDGDNHDGENRATIRSEAVSRDGSGLVSNLVSGVNESVYENIFAIGLYELQELATLESQEVAEHIYSVSLGLDGQQLLDLIEEVKQARNELLDIESGQGRMAELYADVTELDAQLEESTGNRRRHAQLCEERDRWEETIVEFKERQQGLEHQLNGHEFLAEVHEPWLRVRELEKEIARLPHLPDFPENGLASLEEIETELAAVRGRRNALLTEAKDLSDQRKQIAPDPEFRRYTPAIQAFVDQRDWIAEMHEFADECDSKGDRLREQLSERLSELGEEWSEDRLRRIETSHLATNCLMSRARGYRELDDRNQKQRDRYRRLSKKFHRRQEKLEAIRSKLGGVSVQEAIEQTREELERLEDLSRLRIRETELTQRRIGLANQLHRMQLNPALPQWVNAAFVALGIVGLSLGLIGLVTGFLSDGLAGLTYALAGAFCTGTPIALKRHFEGEVSRSKLRIEDEIREMETRIKETREAVACIAPAVARLRDRHGNAGAAAGPVPHQSQTLKHSQAAKLVSLSSGQEETSPVSRVTGAEESPPAPAEREIVGAGTVGTETVGTEPVTAENVSEEDVATDHDAVPGGNAASIDEAPDEDGTGTESESSESIEDIMLRVSGLSGDPSSAGSDGGSPSEEHGDSEDSETGEDRDPADQARTKSEEETGSPAGSPRRRRSPPRPTWLSETDLLRQCLERLRELELAERLEEWVNRTRPELVEMRHHLRDLQRDFGTARQDWCSHLVEHGLQETVDIDAAIIQRDQVGRAALLLQQIDALQEETQVARRMSERFRKRIEELGHRLQQWDVDYSDPLGVLDQWSQQLARHADVTRRRRELKREARQRRIEASKYRGQIRRLESQRDAILVRGGAVSREEFEDRAALLEKRFELQERLNHAKQELADVSSSQGTMAVVQTDLEKYDAEHNAKCIETIRQELDDLAIDIEDAFENLGRFKREVELLENDSTSAELRFEREQQLSELTSLAEEWFALAWSVDTLEELRIEFERNHQPPVLARAKEYLNRISRGRYQNIWTPLGQRTLCVDDSEGNTLTVEYLSGGTREQLFLSIRFALVEHFCEQGVELPIILDDVLVNFDEDRTRAAIEELLQKTAEHRQILYFTCHQHLAEMFRQRGISTVTLPDRRSLADHDNELMAG